MQAETYTLILTRGTHLVSAGDAVRISEAIECCSPLLEVALDPFGAVDDDRRTTLVLRHVVALTKNPRQTDQHSGGHPAGTVTRFAPRSPLGSARQATTDGSAESRKRELLRATNVTRRRDT